MSTAVNRRTHERFVLSPMYTPVSVRLVDEERFGLEGHAYNISEGGLQFELDRPVPSGTEVAIQITLPQSQWSEDIGPGPNVLVFANVIWVDESEPGPVRMAAAFTRFARLGDRERLMKQLGSGRFARAA